MARRDDDDDDKDDNQIRKRYLEDIDNQKEELMKVTDDLFDVLMPLIAPEEIRLSKRKMTFLGKVPVV